MLLEEVREGDEGEGSVGVVVVGAGGDFAPQVVLLVVQVLEGEVEGVDFLAEGGGGGFGGAGGV